MNCVKKTDSVFRRHRLYFGDQKGAAIPAILVISMMVIIISLSITWSIRQQIDVTREINDRSLAYVKSYDALNRVLYLISTGVFSAYNLDVPEENGQVQKWNLYGKPVEMEKGVYVSLQDASGLFSPLMHQGYIGLMIQKFRKGFSDDQKFLDTLADWQDKDDFSRVNGAEAFDYRRKRYPYGPRNNYIQTIAEMRLIMGYNPETEAIFLDDLIYWRNGPTNCMTLSKKMLQSLLPDDTLVNTILDLRDKGDLTPAIFRSMTGIQTGEDVVLTPYGWIRVRIQASVGQTTDRIDVTVVKSQRRGGPFWVAEWRR